MHIIVCAKQITDPEAAREHFSIDEATMTVVASSKVRLVMSPFDEQAVEAALRIRDRAKDTKITILSLGSDSARDVIKHGLSMGADDGVLVADPIFANADSHLTAVALAAAIRKIGSPDLILSGRQAADWDAGVVGLGLAELLGISAITFARDVRVESGAVRVERVLEDGFETVEAPLPAAVTVSNELGQPRYPNLRQVMRAGRIQPTIWSAADLGLDPDQVAADRGGPHLERLFMPVEENQCEFIAGESPQEMAANLVGRMVAAKII